MEEELKSWYEADDTIKFDEYNGFWRDYDLAGENADEEWERFNDESIQSGLFHYQFYATEELDADILHLYYNSKGQAFISIKELNGDIKISISPNHKDYNENQIKAIIEKKKQSLTSSTIHRMK